MVSARHQPMGIKKIRQAPYDDRQKAQQKDPVVSMRNKFDYAVGRFAPRVFRSGRSLQFDLAIKPYGERNVRNGGQN